MSARPKRNSKTPSRFHPSADTEHVEKAEKSRKLGVKKTKTVKKARKQKDPNAPKRALTGYLLFSMEERAKTKAAHPEHTFGEIAKALSEKWKGLSDEEKAPYLAKAAKDKKRYEAQLKEYKGKSSDKEESSAKSSGGEEENENGGDDEEGSE